MSNFLFFVFINISLNFHFRCRPRGHHQLSQSVSHQPQPQQHLLLLSNPSADSQPQTPKKFDPKNISPDFLSCWLISVFKTTQPISTFNSQHHLHSTVYCWNNESNFFNETSKGTYSTHNWCKSIRSYSWRSDQHLRELPIHWKGTLQVQVYLT